MLVMEMSYKINHHIQEWIDIVEKETYRVCEDQKKLIRHVKKAFETENIYVDDEQFEKYIGLAKYFPWKTLMPWQKFVVGLHDCTYYKDTKEPRWPDLFCLIGRGAGKDGTIAWESVCLTSPYNPIKAYDVDICANNEEQAMRPVQDIIEAFEDVRWNKKLKKYFYWAKEKIRSIKTGATIRGRTNNPKGRDGMRSGIIIFNEEHQYQDYKNIDVFTTGLGKKEHPRSSTYTTQGDVREGPLDDDLATAEEVLNGEEADNGKLYFICRLDTDEEVHDEANWTKANPSLPYFPHLLTETRKEYKKWKKRPNTLTSFMTKRMNRPATATETAVTEWGNILKTNKPMPDLSGETCVAGIDYTKTTDLLSINLHFRKGDERFDINHSWLCLKSKDLWRLKIPWKEWAEKGLLTLVDDVEIHPKVVCDYLVEQRQKYFIKTVAVDDYRYTLLSKYLNEIGYDTKNNKNLKLVRPSDIMKTAPIIESCFANGYFNWGDNPLLRWATNNTKLIRVGKKAGKADDADIGNFAYGKIEGKSRKTDPFMSVVASMTIEDEIPTYSITNILNIGVYTY